MSDSLLAVNIKKCKHTVIVVGVKSRGHDKKVPLGPGIVVTREMIEKQVPVFEVRTRTEEAA